MLRFAFLTSHKHSFISSESQPYISIRVLLIDIPSWRRRASRLEMRMHARLPKHSGFPDPLRHRYARNGKARPRNCKDKWASPVNSTDCYSPFNVHARCRSVGPFAGGRPLQLSDQKNTPAPADRRDLIVKRLTIFLAVIVDSP